jgi:hypothetical protein
VSNASKRNRVDDRRVTRRTEDMARDLELLAQRLAESREAIVRLLATDTTNANAEEPPSGPRLLRDTLATSPPPDGPGTATADGTDEAVPSVDAGNGEEAEGQGTDGDTAQPPDTGGAARRRLLAVVLLAIGAVILLTTLVSLL